MPIHLCAEHLQHISTLSIQASLATVSNRETKASLSADGTVLTLRHEGEAASIVLPINLSPNQQSHASMFLPAAQPTKEVTFRVQLEQRPGVNTGPLSAGASEDGDPAPWTATDLTAEAEVSCKSCAAVLVPRGRVRSWKDLPSEGWAEMMEYWHCHKPVEGADGDHDHAGSTKGYAAGSKLAVQPGVVLIGPVDFLLMPEDCENVETSLDDPLNHHPTLHCTACAQPLGHIDAATQGYKLRKPHLAISPSPPSPTTSFPPAKWLSSLLLHAAEAQGVRKFHVHPSRPCDTPLAHLNLNPSSHHHRPPNLKLWLFAPSLAISTSARTPPDPMRVAKILWRDDEEEEEAECSEEGRNPSSDASKPLNAQALAEGDLELPADEVALLRAELEASAAWLPPGARTFAGGWRVGVLERFGAGDGVGGGGGGSGA